MMNILAALLTGKDLSRTQAEKLIAYLFSAKTGEGFIRTLLLALRKKGESLEELASLVEYLRKRALPLHLDLPYLTDFCGTGGDQKKTFNISTLAALVAAGAGAYVVKHGNRSVSSHCGSSDLMEKLGVRLKIAPKRAEEILGKAHFVYLHAPFFHPAFRKVQPARQAIKTKTVFNFLGPLLNPAQVAHQIIGVSDPSLLSVYPEFLRRRRNCRAWVVMNEDGYDEISLTGNANAVEVKGSRIRHLKLTPGDFGLKKVSPRELVTSNLKENVAIARSILEGKEKGPRKDVVLANAALGLLASGRAHSLREGVALARFSLETGKAHNTLEKVIQLSR